jgi:hypothetical protein
MNAFNTSQGEQHQQMLPPWPGWSVPGMLLMVLAMVLV